jgi:hypothetical protein
LPAGAFGNGAAGSRCWLIPGHDILGIRFHSRARHILVIVALLASRLTTWARTWRLLTETLVPWNPSLLPLGPAQVVIDLIVATTGSASPLRDHIDIVVYIPTRPAARRLVHITVEIILVDRVATCFRLIVFPGIVLLVTLGAKCLVQRGIERVVISKKIRGQIGHRR